VARSRCCCFCRWCHCLLAGAGAGAGAARLLVLVPRPACWCWCWCWCCPLAGAGATACLLVLVLEMLPPPARSFPCARRDPVAREGEGDEQRRVRPQHPHRHPRRAQQPRPPVLLRSSAPPVADPSATPRAHARSASPPHYVRLSRPSPSQRPPPHPLWPTIRPLLPARRGADQRLAVLQGVEGVLHGPARAHREALRHPQREHRPEDLRRAARRAGAYRRGSAHARGGIDAPLRPHCRRWRCQRGTRSAAGIARSTGRLGRLGDTCRRRTSRSRMAEQKKCPPILVPTSVQPMESANIDASSYAQCLQAVSWSRAVHQGTQQRRRRPG
jgi:hypothetical protein